MADIEFDLKTARALLECFGGDDARIAVTFCREGHSGAGLYAHHVDYPEDGSEFLGLPDGSREVLEAIDAAARARGTII